MNIKSAEERIGKLREALRNLSMTDIRYVIYMSAQMYDIARWFGPLGDQHVALVFHQRDVITFEGVPVVVDASMTEDFEIVKCHGLPEYTKMHSGMKKRIDKVVSETPSTWREEAEDYARHKELHDKIASKNRRIAELEAQLIKQSYCIICGQTLNKEEK